MTRSLRLPGRTLLIAVLAIGLVGWFGLPAVGFTSGIVHFFANFNDPPTPGPGAAKTWVALGGQSTVQGDQDIFNFVFPTPEDGEVEIVENLGTEASQLICDFDTPVYGEIANISFSLEAVGGFSDLDVRFDDVGDTGVLDMHFNEDRHVVVEGKVLPLPLLPGETEMLINVTLQNLMTGGQMFTLTVVGPSGSAAVMGMLNLPGMNVADLHFIRAPGVVGGRWHVDDVFVTSQDTPFNQLEVGLQRK